MYEIAEICTRIRQLRVEYAGARGKAAFARELGISASTYDYYERDRVPPADVLLRIADVAHVDVRWLLTGAEPETALGSGHPGLGRAAKLLADYPQYAQPLAAFVDLLAETAAKFPMAPGERALVAGEVEVDEPSQIGQVVTNSTKGTSGASELVAAMVTAPTMGGRSGPEAVATDSRADEDGPVETAGPASLSEAERQGWIPILGRSAAGVPHFWSEAGGSDAGATMLADLVAMMKPRTARHVSRAEAVGDLASEATRNVQLVLLDAAEPPGTSEFVIAEHIASNYDMLFAVRIDGESMEPEISHGDVVVLSPSVGAEPGKPAVVQLADQIGVTCKLIRLEGDRVHLIPVNEAFAPTRYPLDKLVWALKVIARVRPA